MSEKAKRADLAGPGIGSYEELEKILPSNYASILSPRDTQNAVYDVKNYIERNLCRELNLMMVQVPLIVDAESGVNDLLDRDLSRTPVQFHISNDLDKHPVDAQVVQAATKWKRTALKQFGMRSRRGHLYGHAGGAEGLLSGPRPQRVCRPVGLGAADHRRPAEPGLSQGRGEENLEGLEGSREPHPARVSSVETDRYPNMPDEIEFIHAEEILDKFPDLPRKQRETAILQEHPAVFIIGIGWILKDGFPHEMRAADYDDWATPTVSEDGRPMHGLNGDILVWNPVTERRHELTSMGIRVDAQTLRKQLEISGQLDFLKFPYHQGIIKDELPLSIGGGIGQARTYMLLLKKAHLGEVTVSVWPKILKEMCERKNIHVIE